MARPASGACCLSALGLLVGSAGRAAPLPVAVMPAAASMQSGEGRLPFTPEFRVAFRGVQDARLTGALARTLRALEERSGLVLARTPGADFLLAAGSEAAALTIECERSGEAIPRLGEDESYELDISGSSPGAVEGADHLGRAARARDPAATPPSGWRGLVFSRDNNQGPATLPVARAADRCLPPLAAAGRHQAQPRRHGAREAERAAPPPDRGPGIPHRKQKVSPVAGTRLGRPLLHPGANQGPHCLCGGPRHPGGAGVRR